MCHTLAGDVTSALILPDVIMRECVEIKLLAVDGSIDYINGSSDTDIQHI